MAYSRPNKEIKIIFNHIENVCENLYKSFSNETKKAASGFLLNPKKVDLDFSNWQVDLNIDLEKLKELDPDFFNEIKGNIHTFEKSAKKLIKAYKNKPQDESSSSQLEYFKNMQDTEYELKSVLSAIFNSIRKFNF